jgi:hypothetical protein
MGGRLGVVDAVAQASRLAGERLKLAGVASQSCRFCIPWVPSSFRSFSPLPARIYSTQSIQHSSIPPFRFPHGSHPPPIRSFRSAVAGVPSGRPRCNERGDIAAAVADFLGVRRDALQASTEHYRSLVAELAPHWLDRLRERGGAAGVYAEDISPIRARSTAGSTCQKCFTNCAAPRHTSGARPSSQEPRQRERPQALREGGRRATTASPLRRDTTDLG